MEKSKRAQRRKPDTTKKDLKPSSCGFPEYRAFGAVRKSAKDGARSSPHYGDEGITHSPIAPRCLLAARYGRFMCDPRRPASVPARSRVSDPISKSEVGSDAAAGVGERYST